MKKIPVLLLFLMAIFLFGCRSDTVSKGDIMLDVEQQESLQTCFRSNFVSESQFRVEDLEIDKRQTNLDDKTDLIYADIIIINDYFRISLSSELEYNFYDEGGWTLDNSIYNVEDIQPINCPEIDLVKAKLDEESAENIVIQGVVGEDSIDLDYETYTWKEAELKTDTCVYYLESNTKVSQIKAHVELIFDKNDGWKYKEEPYKSIIIDDFSYDYSCAIGTFESYDMRLTIHSIENNLVDYELEYTDTPPEGLICTLDRRVDSLNPYTATLITYCTYNGTSIPFAYYEYDADRDVWQTVSSHQVFIRQD